ncbi:MAG: hypothetical protein GX107_01730 [Clostridiales bacterium]|jgi:hypothetical protein|nr:hypothetical protein [Clostridiales bacterium]
MAVFEQFLAVIQKVLEWTTSSSASTAAYTALAAILEFIRKAVANIGKGA